MRRIVQVTAAIALLICVAPGAGLAARSRTLKGTVDLLLALDVRPFAIAHRGFGENLGADHSRPIENTVAAVRKGFKAGASVVEVDVQLTRDGRVAAFHNDFLPDLTCVNRLTLAELQARLSHVPTLEAILEEAKHFNQASDPLRGIVIIELKAAAPLCDPEDTQEDATVSAVTQVIRRMRMTHQVLLTSFSPVLLVLAQQQAPDIARILAVSGLQFLTKEALERALDERVTLIDKQRDLGLQWAEIGGVFRLPGYRSFEELLRTAALTNVRAVEADLLLLHSQGLPLVHGLHATGFKVFGFTAETKKDWKFLEALGVDGIYTNDVRMGVRKQASIP